MAQRGEEESDGFSAFRFKPPSRGQPRRNTKAQEWPEPSLRFRAFRVFRGGPVFPFSKVSHVFPLLAPLAPFRGQLRPSRQEAHKAQEPVLRRQRWLGFSASSACSVGNPPFRAFRGFRGETGLLPGDSLRSQREINTAIGWPASALHPRGAESPQSHRFPRGHPHGRAAFRGRWRRFSRSAPLHGQKTICRGRQPRPEPEKRTRASGSGPGGRPRVAVRQPAEQRRRRRGLSKVSTAAFRW